MKINIQNLDRNLLEVEDKVDCDFLESELRVFYPRKLSVKAKLDHFGKDYKVDVALQTNAHYVCDRCLQEYDVPFKAEMTQVYQEKKGNEEATDDILELPANATEIDITPLLEETIALHHPVKMLCMDDCKGLCPGCGADLNNEPCRCAEKDVDPRWAELKKFIK